MLEKGMMTTKATTVIEYIVQRIADEGVEHCFGVPGDYAFPVGDAVDSNPNIKWIGCSNELNAAYAADGYARARGAAMLSTTYAVGDQWSDGRESRALTRLPRCGHAVVSEPALAQDNASHFWRRRFRELHRNFRSSDLLSRRD